MNRWKCTVCGNLADSEKQPDKCHYCGAEMHKIRSKFKLLKKRFDFMD